MTRIFTAEGSVQRPHDAAKRGSRGAYRGIGRTKSLCDELLQTARAEAEAIAVRAEANRQQVDAELELRRARGQELASAYAVLLHAACDEAGVPTYRAPSGKPSSSPAELPVDRAAVHDHGAVIDAVIFDMDGVILDSERVWDDVREALVRERGGQWHDRAQRDMMGMSSVEWSRYMHDELGLEETPAEINAEVVRRMQARYRDALPAVPGAAAAVERIAASFPLGLASSSNRPLIDLALELLGVSDLFRVTVSSEEVSRGKPAPDVYLEAARRLEVDPNRVAAVEDSHNGILSASTAGMRVIAVPKAEFPPDAEAIAAADAVLDSLAELTPEVVRGSGSM